MTELPFGVSRPESKESRHPPPRHTARQDNEEGASAQDRRSNTGPSRRDAGYRNNTTPRSDNGSRTPRRQHASRHVPSQRSRSRSPSPGMSMFCNLFATDPLFRHY